MIIHLIPYLVIIASLVGLAVIVHRKMPVLANLSEEEMTILDRRRGTLRRMREVNYKRYWMQAVVYLEKFLRKVKIVFLKIENLLTHWIERLRTRSQLMAQKSREWMRQRELKRREAPKKKNLLTRLLKREKSDGVMIKIDEAGNGSPKNESEIDDDLPISELEKPIYEEQKWIDLIVENPKNITAYKFLGLLYWQQHNYADAKASLEMAVKLGSKDRKVKEILKKMEEMDVKSSAEE